MRRALAYFDTSVVVKRYVQERGAARARALLQHRRLLSSAITPVEATSALCRRRATGELAANDFADILARLRADRANWELIDVSQSVLEHAAEVVQRTSLRTLDAVQLASATAVRSLSGHAVPFITADARQRDAAEQLGLDVIWVE
jgi:predicted nucleic acid-binding protein